MRVLSTVHAIEDERSQWRGQVALVPTMGFLHEGHLSLFRRARAENDLLVASIFVNPIQFGPHEDLNSYPHDLERDLRLLETVGVDVVFTPTISEMYPTTFTTFVDPGGPLAHEAEGASRPGHFRGVATIVLKLFELVRPHLAYFGQKDAQQVAVISRMVSDFNLPVRLRILPTIREADGLAMSSRNSYLDTTSRSAASVLYRALQAGRSTFDSRPAASPQAVQRAMADVISGTPLARLVYADLRDSTTFLPLETLQPPALLLVAAHVGPAHLIDNFVLHANGSWDTGLLISDDILL